MSLIRSQSQIDVLMRDGFEATVTSQSPRKRKAPRRKKQDDLVYQPSVTDSDEDELPRPKKFKRHQCPARGKDHLPAPKYKPEAPFDLVKQEDKNNNNNNTIYRSDPDDCEESDSSKGSDDSDDDNQEDILPRSDHEDETDIYATIEKTETQTVKQENAIKSEDVEGFSNILASSEARQSANQMAYDVANLAAAGWPKADVKLYRTLSLLRMRPLLATRRFGDLPHVFFTDDGDVALLSTCETFGPRFDNILEAWLMPLLDVGFHVRERLKYGIRHPERWPQARSLRYIESAYKNAGLWRRDAPLNIVVVANANSSQELQAAVLAKMQSTSAEWNRYMEKYERSTDATRKIPIYGLAFGGAVSGIVSYAPDGIPDFPPHSLDHHMRTICTFDWKEAGQDVWNVFTIALAIHHARDELLECMMSMCPSY